MFFNSSLYFSWGSLSVYSIPRYTFFLPSTVSASYLFQTLSLSLLYSFSILINIFHEVLYQSNLCLLLFFPHFSLSLFLISIFLHSLNFISLSLFFLFSFSHVSKLSWAASSELCIKQYLRSSCLRRSRAIIRGNLNLITFTAQTWIWFSLSVEQRSKIKIFEERESRDLSCFCPTGLSVTRWIDYFFFIWPYQQQKFATKHHKKFQCRLIFLTKTHMGWWWILKTHHQSLFFNGLLKHIIII